MPQGFVDIHCHILPGLDDGSRDMATSITMARIAVADGTTAVVATPHWLEDEHEVTPDVIRQAVKDLQAELDRNAVPLTVYPGCEALICPDLPHRVQQGDVMTVADHGKYLLMELPFEDLPTYVDDVIFKLQVQGITPILAHVERYTCVQLDHGLALKWSKRGVLLQVNADNLARGRGREYETAQDLIDHGISVIVASDAHDAEHRTPKCALVAGELRLSGNDDIDVLLGGRRFLEGRDQT
jgi:protein-tyrosine phosphatase